MEEKRQLIIDWDQIKDLLRSQRFDQEERTKQENKLWRIEEDLKSPHLNFEGMNEGAVKTLALNKLELESL